MKTSGILTIVTFALGVTFCLAEFSKASELGTAFTYQGRLNDNKSAADGFYDFQFRLYNDPSIELGRQTGDDIYVSDVDVLGGYFTVKLDFGSSVFDGQDRWLEIGIRPGEFEDEYTLLSPRQAITPAPYALYALNGEGGGGVWSMFGNDINYTGGNVGIGISTPLYRMHTVDTTPETDVPAIYGEHAVTDYYGIGVQGVGLFKGVAGSVNATGSSTYYGVSGLATTASDTGITYGVYGSSRGTDTNYGVYGTNFDSGNYGYLGSFGYGAYGFYSNGNYGYLGDSNYGVYGKNNNGNYGSLGDSNYGVYGKNNNGNYGFLGDSYHGVFGSCYGSEEYGVFGENGNKYGYLGGNEYGVYGEDSYRYGSYGYLGSYSYGVYGLNKDTFTFGYLGGRDNGVYGEHGRTGTKGYLGGWDYGAYGEHSSTGSYGYLGGYGVNGVSGVYGYADTTKGYAGRFVGNVRVYGEVSAESFWDRTPYPKDLATAYQAVMSMERLPDGQYMENDKAMQLDHSKLSDFINAKDGKRDLSATVSCQNEVLKDLVRKQNQLGKESRMIKQLKQQVEVLQKDNEKIKLLEAENIKMKSRLALIESMLTGSAGSLKGAVQ